MQYQNRMLVAARDMEHGGVYLRKGDSFRATPVDADYYVRTGRASDAPPPPTAETPSTPRRAAQRQAPKPAAEATDGDSLAGSGDTL